MVWHLQLVLLPMLVTRVCPWQPTVRFPRVLLRLRNSQTNARGYKVERGWLYSRSQALAYVGGPFFGIEGGTDILLSPTHLGLAAGLILSLLVLPWYWYDPDSARRESHKFQLSWVSVCLVSNHIIHNLLESFDYRIHRNVHG